MQSLFGICSHSLLQGHMLNCCGHDCAYDVPSAVAYSIIGLASVTESTGGSVTQGSDK